MGTGWIGNSAPMMSKVKHPVYVNNNSGWGSFFANTVSVPVGNALWYGGKLIGISPDITINTDGSHLDLYRTTCHELSHASHFSNVGSWYWSQYINYIITYGAYGDSSKKNAGYCGVGEMWGFYVGGLLATRAYPGSYYNGTTYWFRPQIMRNLVGAGLSEKQIFDCLTSSITSHEQLKNKLIERYGKADEIKRIFAAWSF